MKLKECEICYFGGKKKCFLNDENYESLNFKACKDFLDPYEYKKNELLKIKKTIDNQKKL